MARSHARQATNPCDNSASEIAADSCLLEQVRLASKRTHLAGRRHDRRGPQTAPPHPRGRRQPRTARERPPRLAPVGHETRCAGGADRAPSLTVIAPYSMRGALALSTIRTTPVERLVSVTRHGIGSGPKAACYRYVRFLTLLCFGNGWCDSVTPTKSVPAARTN